MTRLSTSLIALASIGCGVVSPFAPDTVEPASDKGRFILAETARFAGIAKVNVRGELTDYDYLVTSPLCGPIGQCAAFGWYAGTYGKNAAGIAFFNRDQVERQADIDLSWNSSHEVCHAVTGPSHDEAHSRCNQLLFGGNKPASHGGTACGI